MKILNGKNYFEKKDINDVIKLSLSVVDNPYHNQDFLLAIHHDERSIVKKSIESLRNSLNWEFISETAINTNKIEEVMQSLKFTKGEFITQTEFESIPDGSVSKEDIDMYEKWLKNIGLEICESEFKKIQKNN